MVLEACLVCIDNSEWMRNGDYTPTRMQAQADAVNLVCTAKTQDNPENTVALMSFAGASPEVHVTLTSDVGKILTNLHTVRIDGEGHFSSGIQVAQLALKHRQNKNQKQRIVLFVGSPISEDEKALVRLGKKLKKNNVAVDVVNFGEESENTGKLESFIAAVNSSDNSHLVTVPPGPHILSDILVSSSILSGEDGGMGAAMAAAATRGAGAGGFDFGGADMVDPELALALRISMEEERARQEREAAAAGGSAAPPPASVVNPGDATAGADDTGAGGFDEMDEDAMLAQALALSLMGDQGQGGNGNPDGNPDSSNQGHEDDQMQQ